MTSILSLDAMPSLDDIERFIFARAPLCPTTQHVIRAYQTGVMYEDESGQEKLNNTSASWNEALGLWYLAYTQPGKTILETGFGRGGSAAVLLAGSSQVGARVISVDPAFRHWAGDTGLRYLHHAQAIDRHILVEQPSETFLPAKLCDPVFDRLHLAYIDGSHLFDIALVDFVLLDRLLEPGGVIAVDDAMSPAVYTLLSFVANNLAYRVGFFTPRLAVCIKMKQDDRQWDYFRPFWVSPNTDWNVHDGLPSADVIPRVVVAQGRT
jgi:predicted O-methyltransferase YrrM